MNLTDEQYHNFHRDGFLVIDGFFNPEELKDFREEVRLVIRSAINKAGVLVAQGEEFDKGIMELEKKDHFYVADIYDCIAQTPAFLRLIGKKDIQYAINRLLEKNSDAPLYTFTNRCRIDPPNDERRTYNWHQEVFYTIPESRFLQTWAPLIYDTTEENGTLGVCVGSHKEGVAKQTWTDAPGRATQIIVNQDVVQKYQSKVLPMTLGQLLIFDSRLFHKSGHNGSSQVRYSLVGMYHDIDVKTFRPPGVSFNYKGKTPKEYYDQLMG